MSDFNYHSKVHNQEKPNYFEQDETSIQEIEKRCLVLHNDDFNTFDFVIDTLVEICKHNYEQATQCAYIVHFNGKCDVKNGTYQNLKPLKDALINKGLIASIE